MKKLIVLLCAGSVLLGCAPIFTGKVGYKSLTPPQKTYPATVAVLPLQDKRGEVSKNRVMLTMIPLVLWGTAVDDKIEKAPPSKWGNNPYGYPRGFAPSTFLQKSLAQELKQSKLFQKAAVAADEERAQGADLILRGELLSTRFTTRQFGYGLSLYCGLFYIFGLPTLTNSQELTMKLELLKPGSDKPVWSETVSGKMTGRAGAYSKRGIAKQYAAGFSDRFGFGAAEHGGQLLNEVLAKAMAKATPLLAEALKAQPQSFWEKASEQAAPAEAGAEAPGESSPAAPVETASDQYSILSIPDTEENRGKLRECRVLNNPQSSESDAGQFIQCLEAIQGAEINTTSDPSEFATSPGCSRSGGNFTAGSNHTYGVQFCPSN